ncbi:phosphatidylserine decarboxylase [Sphingopyxis sp. OPL5]|uniref:phosphatidylserine decarboxylase n=1 Tax=unclassified Sphingopyxis TaxID=2614943 RepID=UPI0007021ED1|nr:MULTISPECIES: phosphatidylserine decarboxylase [unclassified Sphingopyxis]KQZ64909.1 phosphatidylserine decarboxylase [Sphingopyxis sp. Root1497]QNO26402.1 phosphatidylserine decarboxylase [Sphingopyxis sp. OPL5]
MSSSISSNRPGGGIKWHWPSIHPEGRKFVLIAAIVTLCFWLLGWEIAGWLMLGITAWVAAFFRDPVRVTPTGSDVVIAPADGLVTQIAEVAPPPEIAGADGIGDAPMLRVSIFMSVFDVHINRTPIAGTLRKIVYIPGKFLNADLDKASEENERQHFVVERGDGVRIGFTQIAGLVARRILPFVSMGQDVSTGQRIGLIRFGSRVDVYLPAGTTPQVLLGQRTLAGETVVARIGTADLLDGIGQ